MATGSKAYGNPSSLASYLPAVHKFLLLHLAATCNSIICGTGVYAFICVCVCGGDASVCVYVLSRLWFPCVDSQSELCPWDIAVTVPVNLVAVASGELTDQASGEGREEGEGGGEGGRGEEGKWKKSGGGEG